MDQLYSFLGFPEKLARWQKFLPYALLLSVTFALYGTTLYFGFIWDDFHYIFDNFQIQGLSYPHLRAIWKNPYFGQYAPLHVSLLAILYSLSGANPLGYHLAQLLLHATCVCLLYFVLKNIESPRVALLGSLFFAVYPPNSETVAWISETKSTLAFLFFLLSFWFFVRLRARERWTDGVWCAFFLVLSLLSKMSTVVAPVIFLLYCYREQGIGEREQPETGPSRSPLGPEGPSGPEGRLGFAVPCSLSSIPWLVGFFLISAIFTGIHLASSYPEVQASAGYLQEAVLTDTHPPGFDSSSGGYAGATVRLLNVPRLLLFYIRMVFFPHPLSAWHMFRVLGELHWIVGAAWIAFLGLLWLLYRSPRGLQFWELWFLVFLAPVLQIVPFPIWVADRYLYIPVMGAFVLWSKLFFYVSDRIGKLWLRIGWEAISAGILLAFAWHTHNHLPVWRNDLSFWAATTKTCMTSAYCHNNLGHVLLENGYSQLAVAELYQAVQIQPSPRYLIHLGDAYAEGFGDYQRTLLAYQTAQQTGGALPPDFWAKVAKVHYMAGDLDQASRAIETGRKINPDEPNLLLADAFLQWKRGNGEQARRSLQRFLAVNTLYPQTSDPGRLINYYWGHPSEVGKLMTDLGPLQSRPAP